MGTKRRWIISALALAGLLASGPLHAEGRIGVCEGTLHRDRDGLRIGGGAGEGEGICLIGKGDRAKVLAVCIVDRHCWVKGRISDCKDSGECSQISGIIAARKK